MAKTAKSMAQEAAKKTEDNSHPIFAFGKENYILMLVGVGLILLGFILMTGGGSKDPNVFNEEMFDFRRLTLSPILILVGFGIEIYAIMKRPKD
jgi:hypothetical protein